MSVDEEAIKELCDALGETYQTQDGRSLYTMTWERLLDITRGRTKVWSDLLQHVQEVDPAWLDQYRRQVMSTDEHIRGCQARQGIGLPCTCTIGVVNGIAGDAPCTVCGLDNRNGTHSALQITGHLDHQYDPTSLGAP